MNIPIQSFVFTGQIHSLHRAYFAKTGVLHFKNFVSNSTVTQFLQEVREVENYLIRHHITRVNGIPLKYGTDTDGRPIIQRIAFASQFSPVLSNFLKSDALGALTTLLAPYEARIGETEKDGLVVNHYVNAEDSNFSKLGWHTDSPRDLFLGSRIRPMLNVGLHLDDCPYENGGLRVLPGTHNKGLWTLLFRKRYFIDHTPDKREAGFAIDAGDLTIHDGRLWHRVQQAPFTGEKSRRRVMYIPVITGAYRPKHAASATPFYHQIAGIKLFTKRKQKKVSTPALPLVPEING
ncbi:phytanoyl-CoA dioxygenase family protein [Niabella beijingensis]|uniref:phytanoyl-CoA dioxygenase family protein n=1 Tax=Niabella beijingensis TaxID=2872700 RepID=UPI001CC1A0CE|nr:phytanoyl-CoA dioxygenase family protein [Niabella beijingensis]MBZ4191151.1 phytanoyl-CoA dioxygenase family protein [Niabella beijingensis]